MAFSLLTAYHPQYTDKERTRITMPIRTTHVTLIEDAVQTALQAGTPGALHFHAITGRTFWDEKDSALKKQELLAAGCAAKLPWPQLVMTDYLRFSRDGNRSAFEEKYFFRRRKLTALILGECFAGRGDFLDDILDGTGLILGESTWCLPAHNSKLRDHKQDSLPDPDFPIVDLFAAETAALLGVEEQLLHSPFEKISPYLPRAIRKEIRERILVPYLSYHFWWMGDGQSQMLNWTPWITQNVLLSVFTDPDLTLQEKTAVLQQTALSLDYFLDEYGDDGCCSEGAQYYSHAGLCLFGCLVLIDRILPHSMDGTFRHPLIAAIADYIRAVHVAGPCYLNFADCSLLAGHRSAREYLFGKYTGNEDLARFAAADYRQNVWFGAGMLEKDADQAVERAFATEEDDGRLLLSEENLFYHLLQIGAHEMMMAEKPERASGRDVWYESTGLMIARDARTVLAAKAGCNADAHNHNDVGSVILFRDGRPVLIDLGVETYTRKTFSERRYEIWTMRSLYHNLPAFYDHETVIEQKPGAAFRARNIACTLEKESASLSCDLSGAYGDPRIRRVMRKSTLYKNALCYAVIEDQYDTDLACVLSLITAEEPAIQKDASGDFVIRIGELATVCVSGASHVRAERLPIQDPRLQKAWKHDCFRILLETAAKQLTLKFT